MSETHERNGSAGAPPGLHEALDQLYAWAVENQSDGSIVIRFPEATPPVCIKLLLMAYAENPPADEGQQAAEPGPEPEA